MELNNTFRVEAPLEHAWSVLTDVPTIAPCLPGAQLKEVAQGDDGEEYRGVVKVKVGPITASYKGAATFLERDDEAHRVVLRAEGRETKGQGKASAVITATLVPAGSGTDVEVATDLTVSGKVAQLGRGAMADVSAKLMDQFAENLASTVLDSGDGAGATAEGAEGGAPSGAEAPSGGAAPGATAGYPGPQGSADAGPTSEPEPIDLLDAAGAPLAKRILPPLIALVIVLVVIRVLRRRN